MFNLSIVPNTYVTLNCDFWNQPKDFDFNTVQNLPGLAFSTRIDQKFLLKKNKQFKEIAVYLQAGYKSKGYIPESQFLGNNLLLNSGVSFSGL